MKKTGSENFNFIRAFHWIFAASVLLLLASGFQISFPLVEALWPTSRTRLIHLVMSSVLVFSLIFRLYYAVMHRSYYNFIIRKSDLKTVIPLLKSHLFISSEPRSLLPKYDIGQKFFQLSWFIGVVLQTITGLVMLNPGRFTLLVSLVGDLQTFRFIHFLVALWFLFTAAVHIYLSITEDPLRVSALLIGEKRPFVNKKEAKYSLLLFIKKIKRLLLKIRV
ncbi:MAG: hypothetical protein CVU88_04380 [Firmicutes bacterium HGW-Firmicutes-13]|nr:MAG: hypothetical protein CVU88_04380 [Firmicutes bacterium HGW-Firmicutes-13]